MSRAWKTPCNHLPGCAGYRIPGVRDHYLPPKRRKQSKKRQFWKARKKAKRTKPKTTAQRLNLPFPPKSTPVLYKTLRIEKHGVTSQSDWCRSHGKWHCTFAPVPFTWFTGINHPDLVRQWLIKNHFEFTWLAADKPNPEPSPAPEQVAADPPSSIVDPRLQHDQSLSGTILERNGVTTSSPLNSPG